MQTLSPLQLKAYRSRSDTLNAESRDNINFLAFCLSGIVTIILNVLFKLSPSWLCNRFKWCPTSLDALAVTEKEILSHLKRPYTARHVNIGPCWTKDDQLIWTLKLEAVVQACKTPLVLLHGFASGVGLWIQNLDSLSTTYPVYTFDMLGFGRSSRPNFSSDPAAAELQFVTGIEMWRRAVGLDKMILLGHDIGGFLATSYAIRHPDRVERLILVDPWGFPERPIALSHRYDMPNWVKFVTMFVSNFNLLAFLRASGPLGPHLVNIFRRDLHRKYSKFLKNKKLVTRYIYHCNTQHPSGEVGFKAMTDSAGWPIYPMINRISSLDTRMPMSFVYGSRSWINRQPALQIKYSRLNSYVGVQVIDNAGHHVYADQPDLFNNLIQRICDKFGDSDTSS